MTMIPSRCFRFAMLAVVFTSMAASLLAQPQSNPLDPIERAKAYTQIIDQKAEADVRSAITEADRIAETDRARAVRRLREALLNLDLSAIVSPNKRRELVALIQSRMDLLEGRGPALRPSADSNASRPRDHAQARHQAYSQEAKEVAQNLTEIEKLVELGRIAAARARIAQLSQKYPNNPAVVALTSQADFSQSIVEAKQLTRETDARVQMAMNDVRRSAMPATGNVEFPKNWAELTKAREEKPLIGPEEEAILRALEKPVSQPLNNAPFLETVQTLSNLVGKEIYLDKRSLEDAGLDLQRPVNMPGNVSARTALRAVLQSQGLTFVIKDKIIQVVTVEKARDLQVTRAYYMGDLIQMAGPFGGAVTWGPQIDYQQTMANAQVIVDSIKQSIDPMIWKDRGGPAIVTFHYPTMSIIVRAPAEVHADLTGRRYKK